MSCGVVLGDDMFSRFDTTETYDSLTDGVHDRRHNPIRHAGACIGTFPLVRHARYACTHRNFS